MSLSPETVLEVAGVIANLAAVILAARSNWLTWPVGLVGVVLAGWLFFLSKLYADALLQILFFAQGVYGWWAWKQPVREVPMRYLAGREWLALTSLTGVITAIIGTILARRTDAAAPFADTFLMVVSVIGNQLLTRRIIDNWALWVLVDVLYVGLYAYKSLWGYAALYAVFVVIAALAWRTWRRDFALSR